MNGTARNARLRRKVDSRKKQAALAKIVKVLRTVPASEVDTLLARAKTASEKRDRGNLMMTGTAPLEISQRIGDGISRAVESFAANNQLDRDLWYHDESIWRVRSKSKGIYHEVQIAAFLSDKDERLFFIPQACRMKDKSVEATKQTVVKGLIESLPLKDLEESDENMIATSVGSVLSHVWSKAEKLSESELEIIKRRK